MTNPVIDYSEFGSRATKSQPKEQQEYQQPPPRNEDEIDYSEFGTPASSTAEVTPQDRQNVFQYIKGIGKDFYSKYLAPKDGGEEEGIGKGLVRNLAQLPLGLFQKATAVLEMLQPGVIQESLDDIEEYAIKNHLSEEEYNKLVSGIYEGAQYLGSQSQVEEWIEEKTGAPLVPRTRAQELLRLGSFAKGITPGKMQSYAAATGVPAASIALEESGFTPEAADTLALLTSPLSMFGASKISKSPISFPQKSINKLGEGGEVGSAAPRKKLSKPQKIERFAVSEEIPPIERSSFEAAEDILQEVERGKSKPPPLETMSRSPSSLRGRVSLSNEPGSGVAEVPRTLPFTKEGLENSVLNPISNSKVYRKSNAGKSLQNEIIDISRKNYEEVGKLYDRVRDLNSNLEYTHQNLATQLNATIQQLEKIPSKSTVTKKLIKTSQEILDKIATTSEGEVTGLRPIPNNVLIDQIQQLREIINFDFPEAKVENQFKPIIRNIEESLFSTTKAEGNAPAVESLLEANAAYRQWKDIFDNEKISPFRRRSNHQYVKLYENSLRTDDFNALRKILAQSPEGDAWLKILQREIVEDALDPFFNNPKKIGEKKFYETIGGLEDIISSTDTAAVSSKMQEFKNRKLNRRVEKLGSFSKENKALSKLSGLSPEQIEAKFNTRSGIRDLRETLNKTEQQRKLFQKLQDQKILDMLYEGEVKKNPTGTDLQRVLNNKKNYELLREMVGTREAEAMRNAAEILGNRTFSPENLRKYAKIAGRIVIKGKIYRLLHVLPV